MLKAKRIRTANWDSSDKILLRQLIEDKISIIENKNVDTNTSRLKKDAWRKITNNFNSVSATMRETSQLQAQWRGTKMKAKAENSAYKRTLKATGGGPPPKSPDHEHSKLMALIPHEFEEDENEYDCDNEIINKDFEDVEFLEDESSRKYAIIPPPPSLSPPKIYVPSPPPTSLSPAEIHVPSPPPPSSSPEKLYVPSQPSPHPPLDTSSKKNSASFKQKKNCKDDEFLKTELFNSAMENRRMEKTFMQLEHDEKLKTILMERNEKLKTYQMERSEKEKILQMERKHKEELHELKMRRLEEEHFSF